MLLRNLNSFSIEHGKLLCYQSNGLRKLIKQRSVICCQKASITGKALRTDRPPRPAPFDYKNKRLRFWHVYIDPMEKRFDDNSKIVVVEGLPTAGKDKFAKQLADELEMHYLPQPTFDDFLIDDYGFDYRTLNSKLPIDAQYYDDKTFLANPNGRNTLAIQHTYYTMRFAQYLKALVHLFSTGQGVVLQRCPWSDIVFMKAIVDSGYASQNGYSYYKSSRANSIFRLLQPHLVIYLDVPTSIVQERIQQRALPHEKNSKALTTKFLNDVERNYKDIYLPEISNHAHLLVYDWSNGGDMSFVVDDIEQLQFEGYNRSNPKMGDWKFDSLEEKRAARGKYTNEQYQLLLRVMLARFDVPEMLTSGQDEYKREQLIADLEEKGVIQKYESGFNPSKDKGVLWKTL